MGIGRQTDRGGGRWVAAMRAAVKTRCAYRINIATPRCTPLAPPYAFPRTHYLFTLLAARATRGNDAAAASPRCFTAPLNGHLCAPLRAALYQRCASTGRMRNQNRKVNRTHRIASNACAARGTYSSVNICRLAARPSP